MELEPYLCDLITHIFLLEVLLLQVTYLVGGYHQGFENGQVELPGLASGWVDNCSEHSFSE